MSRPEFSWIRDFWAPISLMLVLILMALLALLYFRSRAKTSMADQDKVNEPILAFSTDTFFPYVAKFHNMNSANARKLPLVFKLLAIMLLTCLPFFPFSWIL